MDLKDIVKSNEVFTDEIVMCLMDSGLREQNKLKSKHTRLS
jgi:hypothetical protein